MKKLIASTLIANLVGFTALASEMPVLMTCLGEQQGPTLKVEILGNRPGGHVVVRFEFENGSQESIASFAGISTSTPIATGETFPLPEAISDANRIRHFTLPLPNAEGERGRVSVRNLNDGGVTSMVVECFRN